MALLLGLGESFRCACHFGQGRMVGRIGEGCPVSPDSLGDPVAALLPLVSGDDPVVVVAPEAGKLDFIDPDACTRLPPPRHRSDAATRRQTQHPFQDHIARNDHRVQPQNAEDTRMNNVVGFTNRSLRAQVSHLLGEAYTRNHMSYDLGRLRLNGLIDRVEDSNTYLLTPDGQRVTIFYTKVHDHLLRPLLAANAPPAPVELRHALTTIDRHVQHYIADARLGNAA
jgi:hypothetical protein